MFILDYECLKFWLYMLTSERNAYWFDELIVNVWTLNMNIDDQHVEPINFKFWNLKLMVIVEHSYSFNRRFIHSGKIAVIGKFLGIRRAK